MNIDENLHNLMMSETLKSLWLMSQTGITNVNSKEDLKTAFSTCSMELVVALDNNKIHFDNGEDKAIFYGLLTVLVDFVMDGNLKNLFKESVRH